MARILELDPNAIILLSNTFPYCKSHLARMRNIIGDEKIKRLRWYPSLEKPVFLNLVQISDVCLDPFPFGGCNTSYDAFDYNIPVITLPSEYLHGRFTVGLYNRMGLSDCECIANSIEEYARIATNIGINTKLRHKINRNIEMKKHLIFQEQESVDEWNSLFTSLSN
jgi:predicted O-linked N-acetylglucosamine transferase (SPINDLY family)